MTFQGQEAPPSQVLLLRIHDMQEAEIKENLQPFGGYEELPMFIQGRKQLAFIQFPSIDQSQQALEFINGGGLTSAQGQALSAEFSTRTEVTPPGANNQNQQNAQNNNYEAGVNKRPLDGSHQPFGAAAKRPNLVPDDSNRQSAVLCIRSDLNEADMVSFLESIARQQGLPIPVDFMRINGKNMSFVQYNNLHESSMVLNHLVESPYQTPTGVTMQATYSKRNTIERNNNNNQVNTQQQQNNNPNKKPEDPQTQLCV